MSDHKDRMVFWVSSGERYLKEAASSCRSVKRHMPDVDCYLFTPDETADGPFDEVVHVHGWQHPGWYLNWLVWLNNAVVNSEHDQMLFLDTDVHLLAPIPEVFDLLERFDMAGALAPGRETTKSIFNLTSAFPEINTGVLVFRNNVTVSEFFYCWLQIFRDHYQEYRDNDQGSFRDALWQSKDLSFYVLPPEYHIRSICGGFAGNQVKVLHGRVDDLDWADRHVNESAGMRTWGTFGR